jgi:hypothetical protein
MKTWSRYFCWKPEALIEENRKWQNRRETQGYVIEATKPYRHWLENFNCIE